MSVHCQIRIREEEEACCLARCDGNRTLIILFLVLLQSRVELIDKERCIQLYRLTYTWSGRLGLTTSKASILEYWGAGARVSSGCWHSSQHNTKTKLAIDRREGLSCDTVNLTHDNHG